MVVEETLIIGPMIVDLLGGVCREDRFERPVHPRGVCDALNCIQIKHNFFSKMRVPTNLKFKPGSSGIRVSR